MKKMVSRIRDQWIYEFYLAAYSSTSMINRASSQLKNDIMNLPFSIGDDDIEIYPLEEIIARDVIDYWIEYLKKGSKAKAAKEITKADEIRDYGELFCKISSSKRREYKTNGPIITNSFICYPFYIGDNAPCIVLDEVNFENNVINLLDNEEQYNLRIIRYLRYYYKNSVLIFKPKEKRYWLKSMAIRDADDVFADLVKDAVL